MSFLIRIILIFLLIFLLEFYFFRKVKNTIRYFFPTIDKMKERIISFVFFYLNLYPLVGLGYLIYTQSSGTRPVFPPPNFFFDLLIHFPFWLFVLFMVQCIILFLPVDLLRILFYPFYRHRKESVKKIVMWLQAIILIFFLLYVPARTAYDYFAVSVRVVEFNKPGLPRELNGFKIAFISDLQADRYTNNSRLSNFISKVNQTSPDLVLIAGDLITGTPYYISAGAESLGKIVARHGVYSCVGDHDNWAYRGDSERSLREIKNALLSKGIRMLDNEKLNLEIGGTKIGIAFITNTYVESIDPAVLDSLTNIRDGFDLKIFLTHQPRQHLIDRAVKMEYDLFLAGHTHGGQVTFLFPFFNLSPTLIETRYVRGNFRIDGMLAVVTRGLGMSLVPLRYNSTPEVTLIVLSSERK